MFSRHEGIKWRETAEGLVHHSPPDHRSSVINARSFIPTNKTVPGVWSRARKLERKQSGIGRRWSTDTVRPIIPRFNLTSEPQRRSVSLHLWAAASSLSARLHPTFCHSLWSIDFVKWKKKETQLPVKSFKNKIPRSCWGLNWTRELKVAVDKNTSVT